MPPHRRSVLLATDGQGHNTNGQGLLVLPVRLGSQTRPPTASRDTGSSPTFRPHPHRSGRPAATLPQPYLPVHNNRPNLEVARGHSPLVHHRRRLRQGPLRRLGIPVWSSRHQPIGKGRGAQFMSDLWGASAVCSTSSIRPRQCTILNQTNW
jgi:hypothetical protein